jgi:hypothetical protein
MSEEQDRLARESQERYALAMLERIQLAKDYSAWLGNALAEAAKVKALVDELIESGLQDTSPDVPSPFPVEQAVVTAYAAWARLRTELELQEELEG